MPPARTGRAGAPTPGRRARPPGALRVGTVRLARQSTGAGAGAAARRGHVHLSGDDRRRLRRGGRRAAAAGRSAAPTPGAVRLVGYDPEHLGGGLAGFAPLATAGLLTFVGPGGLARLLDDLVEQIRRINETVLAGEHASLRELAAAHRPAARAVAGGGAARRRRADPARARPAGPGGPRPARPAACTWWSAASTLPDDPTVHRVVVGGRRRRIGGSRRAARTARSAAPGGAGHRDLPGDRRAGQRRPAADAVRRPAAAGRADVAGGLADGLTAPIGEGPQGRPVRLTLGDYPPHALIGGPSGTGKTNLIFAWIGALAARYSPAELEFYLLDFKEGVSFARFAQGRRDPSWLPHMRLVGHQRQHRPRSSAWPCCASSPRSCAAGPTRPSGTR